MIKELRRGALVRALQVLDPSAANVQPGMLGVVFEETNAYGDECGPMVRWFNGTACNVYEGDVEEVPHANEEQPGQMVLVDFNLRGLPPYELKEHGDYEALRAFFDDLGYEVRSTVLASRRFG